MASVGNNKSRHVWTDKWRGFLVRSFIWCAYFARRPQQSHLLPLRHARAHGDEAPCL